jgi:copper chaperone
MHQILNVQGMTCGHCERAVTQAVKSVDPQATVTIDRAAGIVEIDSDSDDDGARDAIVKAIVEEGYAVA